MQAASSAGGYRGACCNLSEGKAISKVETAMPARRVLDIGCGANKVAGAIGMDVNPRTAADVIHALDELPYPFADDEFDEVIGRHVIEHVHDPIAVMSELHRDRKSTRLNSSHTDISRMPS